MKKLLITNSQYNHLWDIINDYSLKDLIICLDKDEKKFFINKINYNKEYNYTKRLKQILEQINDEYVFLIHDVDLIINFNENIFDNYLSIVKENNIDRLSFGVYDTNKNVLSKYDLSICNINNIPFGFNNKNKNFFTPFDYSPSIYKKDVLLDICNKFIDETYHSLELNNNLQNYINDNYNFYGIQKNDIIKLKYHRGFVYSEDLNFLHITTKGKLLPINYYFDLQLDLINIIKKYNLNLEVENIQNIQKNEI